LIVKIYVVLKYNNIFTLCEDLCPVEDDVEVLALLLVLGVCTFDLSFLEVDGLVKEGSAGRAANRRRCSLACRKISAAASSQEGSVLEATVASFSRFI